MGRRFVPPLPVPEAFFNGYQAALGPEAALVWLNLRWLAHAGETVADVAALLGERTGLPVPGVERALARLIECRLLEELADRSFCVHEVPGGPGSDLGLDVGPKEDAPGAVEVAASVDASADEAGSPAGFLFAGGSAQVDGMDRQADMDAVLQLYHKKIGMLGPTQFEKLRFWVEEQGMSGEVVALAIEETVRQAPSPRINYLEGILRNWYNDGVRTLEDLAQSHRATTLFNGRSTVAPSLAARPAAASSGQMARCEPGKRAYEGVPNAAAYQPINPDLVRRWKELYPDEYGA